MVQVMEKTALPLCLTTKLSTRQIFNINLNEKYSHQNIFSVIDKSEAT